MKLKFTTKSFLLFSLMSFVLFTGKVEATQLSGAYTIDSTQSASASNFKNLNSAITYLTSAGARSDGGPSNSAPFGVSGNVMFDFVGSITTHIEYVDFLGFIGTLFLKLICFNFMGESNNRILMKTYDRYLYPVSSFMDRFAFRFLIGKNIVAIAKREQDSGSIKP